MNKPLILTVAIVLLGLVAIFVVPELTRSEPPADTTTPSEKTEGDAPSDTDEPGEPAEPQRPKEPEIEPVKPLATTRKDTDRDTTPRPDTGDGEATSEPIDPRAASKPTRIEGVVTDRLTGEPVAGASIQVVHYAYEAPGMGMVVIVEQMREEIIKETVTAEDGTFVLDELEEGRKFMVRAIQPGYITKLKDNVRVGTKLDYQLVQGAQIVGRVVDQKTKAGVEGVLIRGFYKTPRSALREGVRPFRWTEHVRSGPDGEFVFQGAPAAECQFFTFHEEYVQSAEKFTVNLGQANRPTFEIEHGVTLEGVVVDSITEKPVPGVLVQAQWQLMPSYKTKTDENGRYRITGMPRRQHRMSFSRTDYSNGTAILSITDEMDVSQGHLETTKIDPAGSAAGVVLDPNGEPIVGARIYVAQKTPLNYRARGQGADTTSGREGDFLVRNLNTGQAVYRIAAVKDGYVIGTSEDFQVEPAELKDGINVKLSSGSTIRGRISDELGAPVPDAEITVVVPPFSGVWFGPGATMGQQRTRTLRSDGEGNYEITGLWGGTYEISVRSPIHVELTGRKVRITGAEAVETRDFSLQIGRFIAGRVVLADGTPAEGARVSASLGFGDKPLGSALADENGDYQIIGLVKGTYRVSASKEGYVADPLWEVREDTDNANLTLVRHGTLVGLVVGSDGAPVTSFTVQLQRIDLGLSDPQMARKARGVGSRTQSFDTESGIFEMKDVAPGSYSMRFTSSLHSATNVREVSVVSEGVRDVGRVVMPKGATIRGSVYDSSGQPVRSARVVILNKTAQLAARNRSASEVTAPGQFQWTATTAEDGAFLQGGLSQGEYSVRISAEQYVNPPVDEFSVEAGAEVRREYRLELAADVSFSVRDEQGQPIISAIAQVLYADSGQRVPLQRSARSDKDGRLVVPGLGPGRYKVRFVRAGYIVTEEVIDVRAGVPITREVMMQKIR